MRKCRIPNDSVANETKIMFDAFGNRVNELRLFGLMASSHSTRAVYAFTPKIHKNTTISWVGIQYCAAFPLQV